MITSEAIQALSGKYPNAIIDQTDFLGEKTLQVRKENLKDVLSFLKTSPSLGFEVLMDLTAVDFLEPHKHTKIVYWLHNPNSFERLRIVVLIARNETLPSVTDLWEGAGWYERELFDFFGILFEGHQDLKRLLMPDNWNGHPLRKDYALTEESVQFKHGVKPKVPSEIIPRVKNYMNVVGNLKY